MAKPSTARAKRRVSPPAHVPYLRLGGLQGSTTFLDGIELPVVEGVQTIAFLEDAFQKVVADRKGCVVIGAKGTGRSFATDAVFSAFAAVEAQKHEADANYRVKRALRIDCPRTADRIATLNLLYRAATGADMPLRRQRTPKSYEELRDMVIEGLRGLGVAVIVVDEAEAASKQSLEVLRDLVALAESTDPNRHTATGYRAVGIGVLLVGTPELQQRLAEQEKGKDAGAWRDLVRKKIWTGRDIPVRYVENHIREYIRFFYNTQLADGTRPNPQLADVRFDPDLFRVSATCQATHQNLQGL